MPFELETNLPSQSDPAAVAFLKTTMDVYARMPSFSATSRLRCSSGFEVGKTRLRTIDYVRPNLFKLFDTIGATSQTIVSDGTLVDMSSDPADRGIEMCWPTPLSPATGHFFSGFGNSLLLLFFGGSPEFGRLADESKEGVSFGAYEKAESGEPSRVVRFYEGFACGHVEALIGERTHFVYRVRYDGLPSQELIRGLDELADQASEMDSNSKKPVTRLAGQSMPKLKMEESFSQIGFPIYKPGFFQTSVHNPDKALYFTNVGSDFARSDTPIDFSVRSIEGKSIRLSALKGNSVLVYFWAPRCPRSCAGLDQLNRIAQEGKKRGLVVVAVSDEAADTVTRFCQGKHYAFPVCADPNLNALAALHVELLPKWCGIGRDGKLVAIDGPNMKTLAFDRVLTKLAQASSPAAPKRSGLSGSGEIKGGPAGAPAWLAP